jgi:hypothetical protein
MVVPWIAKCKGDGWDTYDTEWHGPFKSEKAAEAEMIARFPLQAEEGWHVITKRLVTPRKLKGGGAS